MGLIRCTVHYCLILSLAFMPLYPSMSYGQKAPDANASSSNAQSDIPIAPEFPPEVIKGIKAAQEKIYNAVTTNLFPTAVVISEQVTDLRDLQLDVVQRLDYDRKFRHRVAYSSLMATGLALQAKVRIARSIGNSIRARIDADPEKMARFAARVDVITRRAFSLALLAALGYGSYRFLHSEFLGTTLANITDDQIEWLREHGTSILGTSAGMLIVPGILRLPFMPAKLKQSGKVSSGVMKDTSSGRYFLKAANSSRDLSWSIAKYLGGNKKLNNSSASAGWVSAGLGSSDSLADSFGAETFTGQYFRLGEKAAADFFGVELDAHREAQIQAVVGPMVQKVTWTFDLSIQQQNRFKEAYIAAIKENEATASRTGLGTMDVVYDLDVAKLLGDLQRENGSPFVDPARYNAYLHIANVADEILSFDPLHFEQGIFSVFGPNMGGSHGIFGLGFEGRMSALGLSSSLPDPNQEEKPQEGKPQDAKSEDIDPISHAVKPLLAHLNEDNMRRDVALDVSALCGLTYAAERLVAVLGSIDDEQAGGTRTLTRAQWQDVVNRVAAGKEVLEEVREILSNHDFQQALQKYSTAHREWVTTLRRYASDRYAAMTEVEREAFGKNTEKLIAAVQAIFGGTWDDIKWGLDIKPSSEEKTGSAEPTPVKDVGPKTPVKMSLQAFERAYEQRSNKEWTREEFQKFANIEIDEEVSGKVGDHRADVEVVETDETKWEQLLRRWSDTHHDDGKVVLLDQAIAGVGPHSARILFKDLQDNRNGVPPKNWDEFKTWIEKVGETHKEIRDAILDKNLGKNEKRFGKK